MEILELAVAKLGSVSAVARYLKVTSPYLFQVRSGARKLAPFHVARLAELLERNPAQAFVEAHIQAAGNGVEAATLKRWFRTAGHTIVAAFVAVGLSGLLMAPNAHAGMSRGTGAIDSNAAGSIQCVQFPTSGRRRRGWLRTIAQWLRGQLKTVDRGASKVWRALRGHHTRQNVGADREAWTFAAGA